MLYHLSAGSPAPPGYIRPSPSVFMTATDDEGGSVVHPSQVGLRPQMGGLSVEDSADRDVPPPKVSAHTDATAHALRYRKHDEGSGGDDHSHHAAAHVVNIGGNGEQKDGHHTHAVHHAPPGLNLKDPDPRPRSHLPCFPGLSGFTGTAPPAPPAPPPPVVHNVRSMFVFQGPGGRAGEGYVENVSSYRPRIIFLRI